MTPDTRQWPWPALDHAAAAALLTDHFPETGVRLVPLGAGEFCLALRAEQRVVRVARHGDAAAALQRESCVLAAIAGTLPLPVPRPTYHAPGSCPPFTVHDEVAGELLTRDGWLRMPTLAREKAASDLAAFLKALHGIPAHIGVECGLAQLDGATFAQKLREAACATLYALFDHDSQTRLDAVLARWSSPPLPGCACGVLLHCDVSPGHLLCDPESGRLTGVIDFGDIAIGEPARDFIFIYEDYGLAILSDVVSRYAGENAPALLDEIRKWYLLEAVSWTLEMRAANRQADVEHGLGEIVRELGAQAAQQWHATDGASRRS